MTSRARVVHLTAMVAVLASVLTLASPAPSPAAADTCDGVWVVVDARAAGGSLSTRCAPGSPATGLAALEKAGYDYAFVPRIPGMICTIDARPDPCNGAPASAYWSYWHAAAGGSWTYATVGAGARTPPSGSVEGWRFGDGSAPPGSSPPANRPPPEPEPAETVDTGGSSTSSGTSRGGTGDGAGSGGGRSGSGSGASAAATANSGGTAAEPGTSAPDPDDPTPAATADDGDDTTTTDERAGQTRDERAAPTPSWRPDPVATAEWGNPNPPADDGAAPAPADEQPAATGPAPEQEPTTALASHRSGGGDPSSPVGAAVGVGLLIAIGLLTWRQRLRRTGPAS